MLTFKKILANKIVMCLCLLVLLVVALFYSVGLYVVFDSATMQANDFFLLHTTVNDTLYSKHEWELSLFSYVFANIPFIILFMSCIMMTAATQFEWTDYYEYAFFPLVKDYSWIYCKQMFVSFLVVGFFLLLTVFITLFIDGNLVVSLSTRFLTVAFLFLEYFQIIFLKKNFFFLSKGIKYFLIKIFIGLSLGIFVLPFLLFDDVISVMTFMNIVGILLVFFYICLNISLLKRGKQNA